MGTIKVDEHTLTPLQHEIINELSNQFEKLEAKTGVFVALHSWGDTLPDKDVLQLLKDQNLISTST